MSTDFILAFAAAVRPRFRSSMTESCARAAFVEALPPCERCDRLWHQVSGDRVSCGCQRRPLRKGTPFARTKISFVHLAQAVWHVVATDRTIAARVFGRRYGLRAQTAWRLLHLVRGALPDIQVASGTVCAQVLGRQSEANTAFATAGSCGANTVCKQATGDEAPAAPEPQARLELGYVRAWLTDRYRGVTRRWLDHYLAEWSYKRMAHRVSEEPITRP